MKALIVDDEQPARSTIRLLADWTLYDIDEVLEAETVEQAITCLRRSRPQIIITDIRMPQHDGLELMQWLHQNQPQAQVIVISAYNEFEYAISAMRLGALDYLLKPIQPAQLDAVLRRAAEKLRIPAPPKPDDRQVPDADERILLALCAEGDAELPANNPAAQFLPSPAGLMVLNLFCVHVLSGAETAEKKQITAALRELLANNRRGHVLIGVGSQNLLYLLLAGSAKQQEQAAGQVLAILRETFGLLPRYTLQYNAVWDCASLSAAGQALIAQTQSACLTEQTDSCAGQLPVLPDSFFEAAAHGSREQVQACLRSCLEQLSGLPLTLQSLQTWWEALCERCSRYLQANPQPVRTRAAFLPSQALLPVLDEQLRLDPQQLNAYLLEQAGALAGKPDTSGQDDDVCTQVRQEIQLHYAEQLSLSSLAARYYRNPSYLSRAFKERYHVGLMNFLAETRVEKAKILLKTTDYRVSKIAHLVCYADEKYFCRVFRKISGLSPAEYQNL